MPRRRKEPSYPFSCPKCKKVMWLVRLLFLEECGNTRYITELRWCEKCGKVYLVDYEETFDEDSPEGTVYCIKSMREVGYIDPNAVEYTL